MGIRYVAVYLVLYARACIYMYDGVRYFLYVLLLTIQMEWKRDGWYELYIFTLNVQMRYGAEERRNRMTLLLVFNSQIAFAS